MHIILRDTVPRTSRGDGLLDLIQRDLLIPAKGVLPIPSTPKCELPSEQQDS